MTKTRDEWCTPKWLAEALGRFSIDPCSNDRSHIRSGAATVEERDNGLAVAQYWGPYDSVFINPPYSRGEVLKWVEAWKHTDFVFLLRWDPSTVWHNRLIQFCECVWFAHKRIEFEPPPGVTASTNPFPHALYFKHKPTGERYDNLNKLGRFYTVGP